MGVTGGAKQGSPGRLAGGVCCYVFPTRSREFARSRSTAGRKRSGMGCAGGPTFRESSSSSSVPSHQLPPPSLECLSCPEGCGRWQVVEGKQTFEIWRKCTSANVEVPGSLLFFGPKLPSTHTFTLNFGPPDSREQSRTKSENRSVCAWRFSFTVGLLAAALRKQKTAGWHARGRETTTHDATGTLRPKSNG
jgi:hypothetical protein